ncbi:hypothetical protein JTB14_030531 [Gonioctena quinquepunctata]|nr:hypothetical protein JTB14_030531 [Gonioctena quinquepunctata]
MVLPAYRSLKNGRSVGAAFTTEHYNATFKLPQIATVYTEEPYAVWKAKKFSNQTSLSPIPSARHKYYLKWTPPKAYFHETRIQKSL